MNKVQLATLWRGFTGILMGIVLMFPSGAEAYSYLTCNAECWLCDDVHGPVRWYGNPVFDVHTGTLGSGTSCSEWTASTFRNDFNCALKAWSDIGSSYLAPTQRDDSYFEIDDFSDENDVAFLGAGYFDDETLGFTWTEQTCDCCFNPALEEADIGFNSGYSWISGPVAPSNINYTSDNKAFRVLALHEIGHAVGLSIGFIGSNNHENGELATMNSKFPTWGVVLGAKL